MGRGKLIWPCYPGHLGLMLLVLVLLPPNSSAVSQPLVNQLAVLLRARSPWPTSFPSNTDPGSGSNGISAFNNGNNQFYDSTGNYFAKDKLQDFSHLNNLLANPSLGNLPELHNFENHRNQENQKRHTDNPQGQTNINNNNFAQQLYPLPTAATAATILQAHQSHRFQNQGPGNGEAKGILIAHPVLGPNQFNQHHMDNKLQNLESFKNFQNLKTLQQSEQSQQNPSQHNPTGDNQIIPSINTASYYIGPSQPSLNGIHILKNNMPPPIHHHFSPNQKPIALKKLNGRPPPGSRVVAIPMPSNNHFVRPHTHQGGTFLPNSQQHHHQQQQQHHPSHLATSGPQFISSNLISAGKFNPSSLDLSPKTPPTVTTTTTTTTPTTTTTARTTPSPTMSTSPITKTLTTTTTSAPTSSERTTTRPPIRNQGSHYTNSDPKTTAQIPRPTIPSQPYPNNLNNIQEVILNTQPQALLSSPSTVVGSFRFPDPPTPPNPQSMNTRYELQNKNALKSYWTSKPLFAQGKDKSPHGNGFYQSSISSVSPFTNSISVSGGSSSKWKHEDDKVTRPNFQTVTNYDSFDTSFKPSLQLHSFEDSTSGLKEYITINPPSTNRHPKSLPSPAKSSSNLPTPPPPTPSSAHQFKDVDAKDLPSMESGFRPFNHYAFVNGVPGASTSTTTETSVLNIIRNELSKNYGKSFPWSNSDPTGSSRGERQDRKYIETNSIRVPENSHYYYNHNQPTTFAPVGVNLRTYDDKYETPSPGVGDSWRGRVASESVGLGGGSGGLTNYQGQVTTSSSERFEDWRSPTGKPSLFDSITTTTTYPIFTYSGIRKNPLECDKFHRFGFCPVTSHYPLAKVESIGSRCLTLLSHLIAPLPKTDLRYDIIVPRNGSHVKGRSGAPSGWSWKTFAGKPVCDTKEVKILPGWAKNEQGEWLVILQTETWKQEAQISLCTSQGAHCDRSTGRNCESQRAKCVQRFTAQRLVVLDPLNQDRCPVVRSVFLPSACVCLSNEINQGDLYHKTNKKAKRQSIEPILSHANSSGGSSSQSKVATGRSLSTSFFGFPLQDLDLDSQPDSSTSADKHPTSLPLSSGETGTGATTLNNVSSSSEERDSPVISRNDPGNLDSRAFMASPGKVVGVREISSTSSSFREARVEPLAPQGAFYYNKALNNNINNSYNDNNSFPSSVMGSSFIVSSR